MATTVAKAGVAGWQLVLEPMTGVALKGGKDLLDATNAWYDNDADGDSKSSGDDMKICPKADYRDGGDKPGK